MAAPNDPTPSNKLLIVLYEDLLFYNSGYFAKSIAHAAEIILYGPPIKIPIKKIII